MAAYYLDSVISHTQQSVCFSKIQIGLKGGKIHMCTSLPSFMVGFISASYLPGIDLPGPLRMGMGYDRVNS